MISCSGCLRVAPNKKYKHKYLCDGCIDSVEEIRDKTRTRLGIKPRIARDPVVRERAYKKRSQRPRVRNCKFCNERIIPKTLFCDAECERLWNERNSKSLPKRDKDIAS